jgi:hypothetical protein
VLRLAGRAQQLLGRRRRALGFFGESIVLGEKLGARPETARTYAEIGRLLRAEGGRFRDLDAEGWRGRARDAFDGLGLLTDLERLERS